MANIWSPELNKVRWKWDFFGDGTTMVFVINHDVNIFKRMVTKCLFGSVWIKL